IRLKSPQITIASASSAYHSACTDVDVKPVRCETARQMMKTATSTRVAASASAARCSAFPCPYAWLGSAGRPATPTAKNVRSAATRSMPECAASELEGRMRLPRGAEVLVLGDMQLPRPGAEPGAYAAQRPGPLDPLEADDLGVEAGRFVDAARGHHDLHVVELEARDRRGAPAR